VLTSELVAETAEGTTSLEFGMAELGWWLNGTCAAAGKPCAANATCTDVKTPTGEPGHRCACVAGMDGDGCYLKGESWLASASKILCCTPQGSARKKSRLVFVVGPAAPVRHVSCTHKSSPAVSLPAHPVSLSVNNAGLNKMLVYTWATF
jgi:hypothetical protein